MALFDRVKSFFTGERPEEDDDEEFEDDDELEEDETDENPDGFGSDDDNPDGFGEEYVDPRSFDEDDVLNEEPKENDKKEKKKKVKEETEEVSKGKKKVVLDPTAMNALASRLKCGKRTKKVCPFCKQQSIYPEPMGTKMVRGTLLLLIGINRNPRYVCLNKNCKAFYKEGSPRARFVENFDGKLKTSHGFHTPENPMSIRPSK